MSKPSSPALPPPAPTDAAALMARGVELYRAGRLDEAISALDHAVAVNPGIAEIHNTRGVVLRKRGRLDAALASYERALALKPDFAEAHNNRGNVQQDLRQLADAMASFDHAIALRPDYANAWWNKARLALLQGDYALGWQLAEWRWQGPQRGTAPPFAQPLWLGDRPVADKTLLIHAEQGLGDCIQYCRYAPIIAAMGARVVLVVPDALVPLLRTLDARVAVVSTRDRLPAFDLHCPVMSLPHAMRTTLATIPANVPYLHADPALRTAWQQRLGPRRAPRIGLAWSGAPQQSEDHRRSLAAQALAPLLQLPFEFHALQKDVRPVDQAWLAAHPALHLHGSTLESFADTAALATEMDLCISVCTSIAHLAGALARPLWVLLMAMPHYVWHLERTDSPWYPTATLFRQPTFGDWDSVIASVAQQLRDHRFAAAV